MHPKIRMFLEARDRADARGDLGIVRATTADLRRWGVPDTATLANPTGVVPVEEEEIPEVAEERNRGGRPKLPRCEHGLVADRCGECNEELAAR